MLLEVGTTLARLALTLMHDVGGWHWMLAAVDAAALKLDAK